MSSRLQVFSFFADEELVQLVEKIKEFIDMEGRSCSMDIDGITPEYVQRMLGGTVPLEEIEAALKVAKERWRESYGIGR